MTSPFALLTMSGALPAIRAEDSPDLRSRGFVEENPAEIRFERARIEECERFAAIIGVRIDHALGDLAGLHDVQHAIDLVTPAY
jgi:hypothetical protein